MLRLRGGKAPAPVPVAVSPAAEPEVAAAEAKLPEMDIANIAKFDNWDHRECAVENKQEWKDYMDKFLKENPEIGDKIPKKIHQIWIGPKQPVSRQEHLR